MTRPDEPSADEAVDRLAEEFVARVRRGEAPAVEAYAEAYPALADRIRRLFPMLALMEGVRGTDSGTGTRRSPPPDTELPERIGAYEIVREVGRGGMGRVFEGRSGDERVAVKVVHAHLLADPRYVARFLREAEAGIRIDHPHVVRTLEAGVMEEEMDAPYLVLEFVEGRNLRTILQEVGHLPERLCLHVGQCVSEALVAFHAAGIVHRDIKPENVVLTANETVKVMDMGVALLQEEAFRLSRTGDFVGSPLYAAPEQLLGGDVDGRTDLYALGLLLFELATGQHAHRIAGGKRGAKPPVPSTLNPSVSPFLDAVIQTLLAPIPEDRFDTADRLRRTLAEGDLSAWWRRRSSDASQQASALRLARVPRPTAFHGRVDERRVLDNAWAQARAGEGRVVLLEGEAGIGKSRLLHEWISALPSHSEGTLPRVIVAQHAPGEDLVESLPLSAAVREALDEGDLEGELERLLADHAWLVEPLVRHLRGNDLPGGRAAAAATAGLVRLLHAMAREAAVVVVVEDLHFAGEASRTLFLRLAQDMDPGGMLLLGTTRPSTTPDEFASLDRLEGFTRLPLSGLASASCRTLLAEALDAEEVSLGEMAPVVDKSDGNPFFLLELAREWLRKRRPSSTSGPEGRETASTLQVPSSVRGFLRERLASLTEPQRELLGCAACYGYEFDPVLVARAAGVGLVPALQDFGRLERAQGLLRAAGPRYRFQHHLVQETLREETHSALREAYHTAIGEALLAEMEASGLAPEDVDGARAVDLCTHLLRGKDARSVRPYLLSAVNHLLYQSEYTRSTMLLERAVEAEGALDDELRAESLRRLGSGLVVAGRPQEGRQRLLEALHLAEVRGFTETLMFVHEALARHLRHGEALEAAVPHARKAVELASRSEDPQDEAAALAELATCLNGVGLFQEARACGERGLTLATGTGRPHFEIERNLVRALSFVDMNTGDLEGSRAHLLHALEICHAANEPGHECTVLQDLARLATRRGLFNEATGRIVEALDLARELELQHLQGSLLIGAAICTWEMGRFDDADRYAREALDTALRQGRTANERFARALEGHVRVAQGRWREALEILEGLVEADEASWGGNTELHAASYLADLVASLGRPERGARLAVAARKLAQEQRQQLRATRLIGTQARIALAAQDAARARDLFEEAIEAGTRGGSVHGARELGLGCALRALGEPELARQALEEAMAWARRGGVVRVGVMARAHLAGLEGGDRLAARVELESHGASLPVADRMEAHFLLWEVDGDAADLEAAKRELAFLVDNAPAEHRTSMVENVPLHRRIAAAP